MCPNTFRAGEFEVKEEGIQTQEPRVVKAEVDAGIQVFGFQLEDLHKINPRDYQDVRRQYGPLAATDSDRQLRTRKDARFHLNPLLREPLSVEQEELRVLEERVRERVQSIADEVKAEAAAYGYQEGLERGYREAYDKFKADGAERLKAFESIVAQFVGAKEEIFRANERFLMEVVFKVAKRVMLKELSEDKDYLLRLIKDLVERVGARENIKIRVNPKDQETIGMLKEGLDKAFGTLGNLAIEASPLVHEGGCLLDTEWNAIDASLETQFKGIHEALAIPTAVSNVEMEAQINPETEIESESENKPDPTEPGDDTPQS